MFISIEFKLAMIISNALRAFGRRSRKLGPIQKHVTFVTCLTFESGRDNFIGIKAFSTLRIFS